MKHVIIGTAGHIDHGKTALIKALTGVNTDRLEEEQRRGISIVLGFAELKLPSGVQAGIVDVPGHERFVRSMLAGVAGIDLVLFVIAADEGVMPQTVEHLEILELIGVRRGIVVLTKIDLVDEEWQELVDEDIRTFLQGTFLAEAPILKVSSSVGSGIEPLRQQIDGIVRALPGRPTAGVPRLPIDRVFSIQGIGTVVTGTLWSGTFSVKETVDIQPADIRCKIRNIQVHDQDTMEALAGQRTAIALQGVDRDQISRGDVVTTPDELKPTYMLDVKLETVRSLERPIKNRQKVHFHLGTCEALAHVVLLDRDELARKGQALAQLRLEEPVVAIKGDRFVIRQYSPVITIAGGMILDVHPPKHRRFHDDVIETLKQAEQGNLPEVVLTLADHVQFYGVTLAEIAERYSISVAQLRQRLLDSEQRNQLVIDAEGRLVHRHWFEQIAALLREKLAQYHREYPLRNGAIPLEIRTELPGQIPESIFAETIRQMVERGDLEQTGKVIKMKAFTVNLSPETECKQRRLVEMYEQGQADPPGVDDLPADYDAELIRYCVELGELVRINRTLLLARRTMDTIVEFVTTHFETNTELAVGEFRDKFEISRKNAVPILEYLDKQGITQRDGDVRRKGNKICNNSG